MKSCKNNEKILLINDFLSSGNIGGSLCKSVLNFYSFDIDFIPTALISNMFSLKPIEIFDSSNFLTNTLEVYKKQNRKYKAIFVGFVLNFNQAKIICDFVKENNLFMVLDPIMGDSGKIYSGLDKNIVEIYKYMADYAHIIIPNLTEAKLLTDNKFEKAHDIVDYFENIGKKFIITSVEDGNRHFILAKDKNFIEEDYKFLDKSFGGSGDLFDSIFLANYLKNNDFLLAIKDTRDMIACILDMQIKIDNKANDISINEILKKL
ncbi:bifunctional hydroxymethylpyrimidine kinase/phosphomethylpyrimidine kinase [Anaerococcus vaginalis]|uniref:bifunctional hydroxymethylpyrimidine kinase/phosphomethylpyrimidine kinase n=1 Tax=Anaerococcus vaginalis TaxID=33037 RepID=UPI00290AFC2D|nr:bifunctional hydroxymethylpyrimidine kinase/phosphomethylpyrimidine kinase [Anaerococcus vaginalis]MDU5374029.1 bifunctional hydroxymethylpyrimidine kinase/phosphomethylpyrimidine kinase [Anaerococcus vaginalis]